MEERTSSELIKLLEKAGVTLSDTDRLYLQKHFRMQLKQAFVHGIMAGPDGNFDKFYEQKYSSPVKYDDHFGI